MSKISVLMSVYKKENPEYLITIYKEQAIAKYNAGDFEDRR